MPFSSIQNNHAILVRIARNTEGYRTFLTGEQPLNSEKKGFHLSAENWGIFKRFIPQFQRPLQNLGAIAKNPEASQKDREIASTLITKIQLYCELLAQERSLIDKVRKKFAACCEHMERNRDYFKKVQEALNQYQSQLNSLQPQMANLEAEIRDIQTQAPVFSNDVGNILKSFSKPESLEDPTFVSLANHEIREAWYNTKTQFDAALNAKSKRDLRYFLLHQAVYQTEVLIADAQENFSVSQFALLAARVMKHQKSLIALGLTQDDDLIKTCARQQVDIQRIVATRIDTQPDVISKLSSFHLAEMQFFYRDQDVKVGGETRKVPGTFSVIQKYLQFDVITKANKKTFQKKMVGLQAHLDRFEKQYKFLYQASLVPPHLAKFQLALLKDLQQILPFLCATWRYKDTRRTLKEYLAFLKRIEAIVVLIETKAPLATYSDQWEALCDSWDSDLDALNKKILEIPESIRQTFPLNALKLLPKVKDVINARFHRAGSYVRDGWDDEDVSPPQAVAPSGGSASGSSPAIAIDVPEASGARPALPSLSVQGAAQQYTFTFYQQTHSETVGWKNLKNSFDFMTSYYELDGELPIEASAKKQIEFLLKPGTMIKDRESNPTRQAFTIESLLDSLVGGAQWLLQNNASDVPLNPSSEFFNISYFLLRLLFEERFYKQNTMADRVLAHLGKLDPKNDYSQLDIDSLSVERRLDDHSTWAELEHYFQATDFSPAVQTFWTDIIIPIAQAANQKATEKSLLTTAQQAYQVVAQSSSSSSSLSTNSANAFRGNTTLFQKLPTKPVGLTSQQFADYVRTPLNRMMNILSNEYATPLNNTGENFSYHSLYFDGKTEKHRKVGAIGLLLEALEKTVSQEEDGASFKISALIETIKAYKATHSVLTACWISSRIEKLLNTLIKALDNYAKQIETPTSRKALADAVHSIMTTIETKSAPSQKNVTLMTR